MCSDAYQLIKRLINLSGKPLEIVVVFSNKNIIRFKKDEFYKGIVISFITFMDGFKHELLFPPNDSQLNIVQKLGVEKVYVYFEEEAEWLIDKIGNELHLIDAKSQIQNSFK